MFQTDATPDSRIAGAAALLADIRRGRRQPCPGLPEGLGPTSIAEAEAIQLATYAALGWNIAGWKVGRTRDQAIACPLPDATVAPAADATLHLPIGCAMELEVALQLRQGLDATLLAALQPADLPTIAEAVILFEFCESRFSNGRKASDLEKLADCVTNGSCVFSPATGAWTWADIETLEMRLTVDGIEVARHAGPHRAMPLAELVAAWRDRCLAIGHLPKAGEIITLGSQTGMLPVPAAGGLLVGEWAGRGRLECQVAPLGS
ncbi:hypothetical protein HB662_08505 [Roseomonas frigidaquae]|uniref:2-keto-4-pentenoate hydratase n=1 Tax=Falsiroseomonas frigidaquae TaxID=487318 RepID=A0ABX1EXJ6_9PROT|nr:hypothetical protein [Falsiroseomonas frigidaquae]NKE44816.1 hypothetical protein [Falsiroseomonas frigidaquae]